MDLTLCLFLFFVCNVFNFKVSDSDTFTGLQLFNRFDLLRCKRFALFSGVYYVYIFHFKKASRLIRVAGLGLSGSVLPYKSSH
jgi:hypothetical protein